MKGLLRRVFFYSLSLFLATQIVSGLSVVGGIWQYIFAGLILTLMMLILKPILQLIAFPFNLITFGLFSVVINAIILFLVTLVVHQVNVTDFSISHMALAGFSSPQIHIPKVFGFLLISVILSGLYSAISWLTQ